MTHAAHAAGPDCAAVEAEVLPAITPTPEEARRVQEDAASLVAQAQALLDAARIPATATVQGSVAKGTWLRGGGDIDLFLLYRSDVPMAAMEAGTFQVGPKLLPDARKKYAQHPYLTGTFTPRPGASYAVDLVPAFAVASASAKMSAVDRTPFHTAWVRDHLDEAARAQVRLAKRWLKGTGLYGAQTQVGGFSGYLVEVLVQALGSFAELVDWLAGGAAGQRIVCRTRDGKPGPDLVTDDVSPLVVVDPVDPGRNCAAAVTAETLEHARQAAKSYQATPKRSFFFPAPPRPEPATTLHAHQAKHREAWVGLVLSPKADRLDIVFPQFQRALRMMSAELARQGFQVKRTATMPLQEEGPTDVLLQWILDAEPLPAIRTHHGPPDSAAPNATKYREKWQGHPDSAGPVRSVAGNLMVDVHVRLRTAHDWLAANLAKLALGKHVEQAIPQAKLLHDPAHAPGPWAPAVADCVLGRAPWER